MHTRSIYVFALGLAATLALLFYTRFQNHNWDEGHHLHPDERFLTMVIPALKFPTSFSQYLNTSKSPLNPHNTGYPLYVYGTIPLLATKVVATALDMDTYGGVLYVGRFLSALLDVGIAFIVFALVARLTKNRWAALFALFFYACLPTAIQLSHFLAVDTWLTFFMALSLFVAINLPSRKPPPSILDTLYFILLGTSLGLAAASKITAILLVPILALIALVHILQSKKLWLLVSGLWLLVVLVAAITFRLAQPYFFTGPGFFDLAPNPKVLANLAEIKNYENPDHAPPFAYQWIPTKPLIYPSIHLAFWGLGLPATLLFLYSLIQWVRSLQKSKIKNLFSPPYFILHTSYLIVFITIVFVYQGFQFAKALRYFYPLMPAVAAFTTIVLFSKKFPRIRFFSGLLYIVSCLLLWNSLAFQSIYRRPHSRVAASTWMYENIAPGSIIGLEHWDDGLPLPELTRNSSLYKSVELPLYGPDEDLKWGPLSNTLADLDYVVLTSNRLWRSISALPEKYPISSVYYQKLFDGSLGFETVHVSSSYPCLFPNFSLNTSYLIPDTNSTPPPISLESNTYCLLALNDDGAEESFTVYDHPKVIILKNTTHLPAQEIYDLITKPQNDVR